MLRIIVIALVLANLLLLGFQGSRSSRQTEPVVEQNSIEEFDVPTIHLFSELMQDEDLMYDNRRCFSLGPFHSKEGAEDVAQQLLAATATVSERQTHALVEQGYWVFLPPYESVLAANKALFSLRALGLEDVAIVREGDWKNAISLGYFLRQSNAVRRKQALEDRGYEPLVRVRRKSEPRYWLDYEQQPGSGLFAVDMNGRPNDFMQRSLPCPGQGVFETVETASQAPGDADQAPRVEADNPGDQPVNGMQETTSEGGADKIEDGDDTATGGS